MASRSCPQCGGPTFAFRDATTSWPVLACDACNRGWIDDWASLQMSEEVAFATNGHPFVSLDALLEEGVCLEGGEAVALSVGATMRLVERSGASCPRLYRPVITMREPFPPARRRCDGNLEYQPLSCELRCTVCGWRLGRLDETR